MNWLEWLQWPAMVLSVTAAYLVSSPSRSKREKGFWWFLASNVAWIAWGIDARAWALIVLQLALALMNWRGLAENKRKH